MASRSRSRQFALQMLFQLHFCEYPPERAFALFWNEARADETTREFAEELVLGVMRHREQLDFEISAYLKNWSLDRIMLLDKLVLELALFELLHHRDVPWKVVIDEAVMMGRLFGGEKSPTFINGVLHAWSQANGLVERGKSTSETAEQAKATPKTEKIPEPIPEKIAVKPPEKLAVKPPEKVVAKTPVPAFLDEFDDEEYLPFDEDGETLADLLEDGMGGAYDGYDDFDDF